MDYKESCASWPPGAVPSSASPPGVLARGLGWGTGERRVAGESPGPGRRRAAPPYPFRGGGGAGGLGARAEGGPAARACHGCHTRPSTCAFPLPQPMGGGKTARGRPCGPCALPFFKNKEKKKIFLKRKLSTEELMLLNCSVGEDLRVPWTARRSNQSILKISSGYSLEGLMLKLKL